MLPDQAEAQRLAERVQAAGGEAQATPEGILLRDPAQNGIVLEYQAHPHLQTL
jgi:hypothetical protein